jgi:hypothetical protein
MNHKYRAKPTVIDGIRFASQKEARRYQELRLLERAGEIHGLQLQPRFPLLAPPGGNRLGEYRADFRYCTCRRGAKCARSQEVVEDVKGFKTPLYRWKKRHVEAQYGIQVIET